MRRQNAELTNNLVNISLLEARCEVCNNNGNNNSKIDSENPISSSLPSIDPLPHLFDSYPLSNTCTSGDKGELIIKNFINADIDDYKKVAFVVLTALVPSITISDIILALPLSLPPAPVEQSNHTRGRIAVLLFSATLVSKVLLARSNKIRISTNHLDIPLLGKELSKHVRHCKIFINEAFC